jgi:hypothetical protein
VPEPERLHSRAGGSVAALAIECRLLARCRRHLRPPRRPVSGEHPSPGETRPNRRWSHRLSRVRNRSKFRRGGHEARWLSLTHSGKIQPRASICDFCTFSRGSRQSHQFQSIGNSPKPVRGERDSPSGKYGMCAVRNTV